MASAPRGPDVQFRIDTRPVDGHLARAAGVPEGHLRPLEELTGVKRLRALRTIDMWCVVDLDERWRVAYRLAVQGGAVIVSEVRVYPREAPVLEGAVGIGQWRAEYLGAAAPVPL